jgi:hypothetical protein
LAKEQPQGRRFDPFGGAVSRHDTNVSTFVSFV